MKRVKVVGIGGIGGMLLPSLVRFLRYHVPQCELTLIDGDRFEPHNAERQAFDALGNKAEIVARRLLREFPEMVIRATPEFVTEETATRLIREHDVVCAGVDNHKTRKILSDRASELADVLVISGGNELTTGSVQVYLRKGGEDLTLPLANGYHPEIAVPQDHLPGEHCEERLPREPQLLITNNAVASSMLSALYAYLQGTLTYDYVYIDVLTNAVRPVNRRKEAQAVSATL